MASDLFSILGIAMKPNPYNNVHSTSQTSRDFANVNEAFGEGFKHDDISNNVGLTIKRSEGSAEFGALNHKGFIRVSFKKDYSETRTFRFNKKEIRVIANYLNSILEDEEDVR